MATTYLGSRFDIHGGGLDLMFPHHENELAQSRAAGDDFAQFWLHNAWVTTSGEKMSKSLGNSLQVREVLKRVRGIELRWYLVSAHYRSNLEYSEDALQESASSFRRIEAFLQRSRDVVGDIAVDAAALPPAFAAAMDDDLGTPAALAVLHDEVTSGNRHHADRDLTALRLSAVRVRTMLHVLGCDPADEIWGGSGQSDERLHDALDALIQDALANRAAARAAKDFATADAIRDRLRDVGIEVEDTADGARWTLGEGV